MFQCAITNKISKPGEKCNKIVIKTREKTYHKKIFNEELRQYEEVVAGTGWEIVKEINASSEGLSLWNDLSPEEQKQLVNEILRQ